ncbi:MAG: hypothetical protein HY692_08095 [Cyanobacteria bacterium NC_groundwater_1444_Ag_S-0.65um_54_12]|nr:hypothetical protein [Cyanobacteria bacterium NC_groundwater_1444_Ag_S-0.65um_54_12]
MRKNKLLYWYFEQATKLILGLALSTLAEMPKQIANAKELLAEITQGSDSKSEKQPFSQGDRSSSHDTVAGNAVTPVVEQPAELARLTLIILAEICPTLADETALPGAGILNAAIE